MFKLVVLVLAVAASALADSQVIKTGLLGSHVLPAGSAYVASAPVAGYASGYSAGSVYPQYQQYAQYPYANYAGYPAGYAYPAGYQNLVAPMPYAQVAPVHSAGYSAGYSAYPSQYLYQQKSMPATPAHAAYSVL